jgi:DNA-damage-inducible protein J
MSTISYSFRIERDTKDKLDEICRAIGMSTATAFNLFAKRMVVERALPFRLEAVQPQVKGAAAQALAEIQERTKDYDVSEEEVLELVTSGRRS